MGCSTLRAPWQVGEQWGDLVVHPQVQGAAGGATAWAWGRELWAAGGGPCVQGSHVTQLVLQGSHVLRTVIRFVDGHPPEMVSKNKKKKGKGESRVGAG